MQTACSQENTDDLSSLVDASAQLTACSPTTMLGEAWTAVSALPWEHPMSAVLALALAQVAMGGFDNVYHHELKERLPWSTTAHTEQSIHCVRGALYTLLFACFAGVTPTGAAAYGLAGVLAVEATLTMYDFVTEDKTRWRFAAGLPPSERVTHTLLTLNYGALLALWLPVMLGPSGWAALPTGVHFHSYGWLSAVNAAAGAGVGLWSVRDYFATKRLQRFAAQATASPPAVGLSLPNQNVLVTGGTGFVGSRLVACLLREGHSVTVLTRNRAAAARILCATGSDNVGLLTLVTSLDVFRTPSGIVLQGRFDVVFNLAGAPLADGRWSDERKRVLEQSRLGTTHAVVKHMAAYASGQQQQPVLVSASAVGYYGVVAPGEGTKEPCAFVSEDTAPVERETFSQRLCEGWEAEAMKAAPHGVRVVSPRLGVVLGRDGGALAQMLPPFEFCLGGPISSGKQVRPRLRPSKQKKPTTPDLHCVCACTCVRARPGGMIPGVSLDPHRRLAACVCTVCQRHHYRWCRERHGTEYRNERRVLG